MTCGVFKLLLMHKILEKNINTTEIISCTVWTNNILQIFISYDFKRSQLSLLNVNFYFYCNMTFITIFMKQSPHHQVFCNHCVTSHEITGCITQSKLVFCYTIAFEWMNFFVINSLKTSPEYTWAGVYMGIACYSKFKLSSTG